jgi:hypothetical protein
MAVLSFSASGCSAFSSSRNFGTGGRQAEGERRQHGRMPARRLPRPWHFSRGRKRRGMRRRGCRPRLLRDRRTPAAAFDGGRLVPRRSHPRARAAVWSSPRCEEKGDGSGREVGHSVGCAHSSDSRVSATASSIVSARPCSHASANTISSSLSRISESVSSFILATQASLTPICSR